MVKDNISNLINGLKNAQTSGKDVFRTPYTKMNMAILEVLKREGFVSDVDKRGKDLSKHIDITLKYGEEGKPSINNVKRVSKQSRRVYKSANEIHQIKNGYGLLVLSTPSGILTDKQARKSNVGGEALFEIW